MSAPSRYSKEVEQIKYSFLAAKAKESIEKLLHKEAIGTEDRESLSSAIEFLSSVSEGAHFVTSGDYSGHNSNETMHKLQLAIDPLKHLENATKETEVADFISGMTKALKAVMEDANKISETKTKTEVEAASYFFDTMFSSLSLAIKKNRRSNPATFEAPHGYALSS